MGNLPRLLALATPVLLRAVGVDAKPRRLSIVAYDGGPTEFPWHPEPVILDLAGLDWTDKPRPLVRDGNMQAAIGWTERVWIQGAELLVVATISSVGPAAVEVVENAARGFPWGSALMLTPGSADHLQAGQSAQVNGQAISGPMTIVREATILAVSIVGAHGHGTVSLAASRSSSPSPVAAQALRRECGRVQNMEAVARILEQEADRVSAISQIYAADEPALMAKAIDEGWSPDEAQTALIAALRSQRWRHR